MAQLKLVLESPDRDVAHRAAALLQEVMHPAPDAVTIFDDGIDNGAGTSRDDTARTWRIEAYFEHTGSVASDELRDAATACLQGLISEIKFEPVPDRNWVALSQAALPPVRAGRFTIYGSHDRHRVARGPNSILIDAGEAFGTAHHATTFGCLLALDRLTRRRVFESVLDLGCGSGVLSVAAARVLPAACIIACDIDAQSVDVARRNIQINCTQYQCAMLHADGLAHPELRRRQPFDLLIANILAGPLLDLAPSIAGAVPVAGQIILSGILNTQSRQIEARYTGLGFHVLSKTQIEGWTTLILTRAPRRSPATGS